MADTFSLDARGRSLDNLSVIRVMDNAGLAEHGRIFKSSTIEDAVKEISAARRMPTLTAVIVAMSALLGGCDSSREDGSSSALTVDDACELLVSKEIHELFDAWAMRFQIVVWCNRNNGGDVAVTITPANAQEGRVDEDLMKSQAEGAIATFLSRRGWEGRYRKTTVQILH